MDLARAGNKYLTFQEPWKRISTDAKRTEVVIHVALQVAGALAIVAEPFLPHTAARMRRMLNMGDVQWGDVKARPALPKGHRIRKAELLFKKIGDSTIQQQIDKLQELVADTGHCRLAGIYHYGEGKTASKGTVKLAF